MNSLLLLVSPLSLVMFSPYIVCLSCFHHFVSLQVFSHHVCQMHLHFPCLFFVWFFFQSVICVLSFLFIFSFFFFVLSSLGDFFLYISCHPHKFQFTNNDLSMLAQYWMLPGGEEEDKTIDVRICVCVCVCSFMWMMI